MQKEKTPHKKGVLFVNMDLYFQSNACASPISCLTPILYKERTIFSSAHLSYLNALVTIVSIYSLRVRLVTLRIEFFCFGFFIHHNHHSMIKGNEYQECCGKKNHIDHEKLSVRAEG